MQEYQIHVGLKSGKDFSFLVYLEDVKEYTDEIQNLHAGKWFSFVSNDFVKYTINKNEIAYFGVSMNEEEILEQDKRNAGIERTLVK